MPSPYQWQANFQWPRSAKKRNILGDGAFAIINRCDPRNWKILLYPTAEARTAKLQQWRENGYGCGSNCCGQHTTTTIQPDEEWMNQKVLAAVGR